MRNGGADSRRTPCLVAIILPASFLHPSFEFLQGAMAASVSERNQPSELTTLSSTSIWQQPSPFGGWEDDDDERHG